MMMGGVSEEERDLGREEQTTSVGEKGSSRDTATKERGTTP
jgi:hypothetical protein